MGKLKLEIFPRARQFLRINDTNIEVKGNLLIMDKRAVVGSGEKADIRYSRSFVASAHFFFDIARGNWTISSMVDDFDNTVAVLPGGNKSRMSQVRVDQFMPLRKGDVIVVKHASFPVFTVVGL